MPGTLAKLNSQDKTELDNDAPETKEENRSERLYKDVDLWRACFVLQEQGRILCHCPPTYNKVRNLLFICFRVFYILVRIGKHVFLITQ
jgi:hypothetical protein